MTEILVLCTANVCRSPMAQALLASELAARGEHAAVRSAGTLGSGALPPPEVADAMAGYGLDVTGHRSHLLTDDDLARADLILAMAREHLRHAAVTDPAAWPRAFTLRELVRRGAQTGPRAAGESLAGWLARAHVGRSRMAMLGDSPADDIADPMGGAPGEYAQTAGELRALSGALAELGWGAAFRAPG
jgi:low molecular weight protein-tyrosine phosphatase